MTRSVPLAIFFVVLISPAASSGSTGNVSLTFGPKLVGGDWIEARPPCIGVDLMCGANSWPVLLNAYASGSWGKGPNSVWDEVSESTYETGIGMTRIWNIRSFRPRIGAGIAHLSRRTHILPGGESGESRFEDAGTRLWIVGGGSWPVGSGANLGATVRFSELRHMYPSLGGTHLGLTLGWGWPTAP